MNSDYFKQIFLPFHKKLYRIAFRFVQSKQQAEDIVQETYIKLWNNKELIEENTNYESYAVVVLRNTCLDFLRAKKNMYPIHDNDFIDVKSIVEDIEMKESMNMMEEIIAKLPSPQKDIMILKHFEDYSDQDISSITGLTEGNIRVILSRVRKTVREQFIKLNAK